MLELRQINRAEGVSLRDHRNQVDACAKTLHDFDVKRLERVTSRADEVEACVDTKINLLRAARLLLLEHVGFVLIVEEFDNGLP